MVPVMFTAMTHPCLTDSLLAQLECFLSYLKATRSRSHNTCRNARAVLNRFIHFVAQHSVESLKEMAPSHLFPFLNQFQAPSYRYTALYYLRQFLDFLEVAPNPARGIKFPRINPSAGIKFMEPSEINAFRQILEGHLQTGKNRREYAIVLLILHTGLRINEVLQLQKTDLLETGLLVVRDSKTYQSRISQAPEIVLAAIAAYHQQHPQPANPFVFYPILPSSQQGLSYSALRTAIRKLLVKAGIWQKNKNLHALRHTFARALVEGGLRREEIQKLLGHKNIQTTEIYTRLTDQDVLKKAPLVQACVAQYWEASNK